jgi:GH15 family glucan-1,4-alpha-glucosidase
MDGFLARRKIGERALEAAARSESISAPHLDGYMGSKPVRIGNGAYNQLQLDIYGELLDAAYLYNKHGSPISYDLWTSLRALTDWVCDNWDRKDEGVWEVRGGQREFVYSKLMCWVALDRATARRGSPTAQGCWSRNRRG